VIDLSQWIVKAIINQAKQEAQDESMTES